MMTKPTRTTLSCKQVTPRLDGLPFLDPSELVLVEKHAETCESCAEALVQAQALDQALRGLAGPTPPVDLTSKILQRVADLEPGTLPEPIPEPLTETTSRPVGERLNDAALPAGLSLGVASQVYALLSGQSSLSLTSSILQGGAGSNVPMPTGPVALTLAAGLLLYAVGLCGPASDEPHDLI